MSLGRLGTSSIGGLALSGPSTGASYAGGGRKPYRRTISRIAGRAAVMDAAEHLKGMAYHEAGHAVVAWALAQRP